MNRFLTQREELLKMLSNITQSDKEEVEPVLNRALDNFQREMKKPIENYAQSDTPDEIKTHIFNILTKHFILCLMNDDAFRNRNIKEISEKLEEFSFQH